MASLRAAPQVQDGAKKAAKHTPGPWQVSGCRFKWRETHSDRVLDSHSVGPDGDAVCLVFYGKPNQHAEQFSNARLIAAAPDMFEALGGLVHMVSEAAELLHDNAYRETAQVLREAVAEARAAMAKAQSVAPQ